ncbi:dienelactone hydrolase family protein [Sphingomicrobium lutaoense]|uniref:Dienelactone hydrolase n=1 Tax=Sphingomicrobium lutaoense TaxID=515949 RepID=A0A839Z1D7_9SPHN|nr:dienelactone hydrolase family protein [Sphingomicrobium lutaoense]MBB3764490.1 dienelactone hydrolase [Sphingomicrobium lutaoense]
MTNRNEISQSHEGSELRHLVMDDGSGTARPGVVIFPSVMNRGPVEEDHATRLVELGYSALCADTFGSDLIATGDKERMFGEMNRHLENRGGYVKRLAAILDLAKEHDSFDGSKIAVMGFCFGGLCTLDLARSGAEFAVAGSFHGLLKPAPFSGEHRITPSVAVFHGWDDPMAPPEDVVALGKELTKGQCDWQVHAYGNVGHGFTNPDAHQMEIEGVEYDRTAAMRSWDSFTDLLAEKMR